jgi:hypothetical protein
MVRMVWIMVKQRSLIDTSNFQLQTGSLSEPHKPSLTKARIASVLVSLDLVLKAQCSLNSDPTITHFLFRVTCPRNLTLYGQTLQ